MPVFLLGLLVWRLTTAEEPLTGFYLGSTNSPAGSNVDPCSPLGEMVTVDECQIYANAHSPYNGPRFGSSPGNLGGVTGCYWINEQNSGWAGSVMYNTNSYNDPGPSMNPVCKTASPTNDHSASPTQTPTTPTSDPTATSGPTATPTQNPTNDQTATPTSDPSFQPTTSIAPTKIPTPVPDTPGPQLHLIIQLNQLSLAQIMEAGPYVLAALNNLLSQLGQPALAFQLDGHHIFCTKAIDTGNTPLLTGRRRVEQYETTFVILGIPLDKLNDLLLILSDADNRELFDSNLEIQFIQAGLRAEVKLIRTTIETTSPTSKPTALPTERLETGTGDDSRANWVIAGVTIGVGLALLSVFLCRFSKAEKQSTIRWSKRSENQPRSSDVLTLSMQPGSMSKSQSRQLEDELRLQILKNESAKSQAEQLEAELRITQLKVEIAKEKSRLHEIRGQDPANEGQPSFLHRDGMPDMADLHPPRGLDTESYGPAGGLASVFTPDGQHNDSSSEGGEEDLFISPSPRRSNRSIGYGISTPRGNRAVSLEKKPGRTISLEKPGLEDREYPSLPPDPCPSRGRLDDENEPRAEVYCTDSEGQKEDSEESIIAWPVNAPVPTPGSQPDFRKGTSAEFQTVPTDAEEADLNPTSAPLKTADAHQTMEKGEGEKP